MSKPAQVGKREYQAAIRAAREANNQMRELLKRIMHEGGPAIQGLVGRASLTLLDNEQAVARLEEIGRNTREIS